MVDCANSMTPPFARVERPRGATLGFGLFHFEASRGLNEKAPRSDCIFASAAM
jgi:hypothetical protein